MCYFADGPIMACNLYLLLALIGILTWKVGGLLCLRGLAWLAIIKPYLQHLPASGHIYLY
jgi:hypothetical protein